MAPLLSVIVPIYNGEKYIDNIYNAFVDQSSKDFELICVDDGSTDNTLIKLTELQKKHSDINVIIKHQDNRGVSAARNAGLNLATGKYISFFDCDDFVSKDYFSLLNDNIDKDFDIFVFQSKRIKYEDIRESTANGIAKASNLELLSRFVNNPTQFGVYNMFVSRTFYNENGFLFKEGLSYYEDYEFLYRVFSKANNIIITEQIVYYYILREGSAMQRFNKARITSVKAIEDLRPYIESQVPSFLIEFDLLSTSRLYWSIMWQACLAFNYNDAKMFYEKYNIANKVKVLKSNSSIMVSLSTMIMLRNFKLYYICVALIGRKKSKIQKTTFEQFENLV